ncbi:MAG: hypothetical protein OXR84_03035 [Magnetovibrio sp.]|nr:hypothetical protein [Magnetovibrio sp.]
MPRETRKLLFGAAELETAALTHCRRHGITVPEGAVGAVTVGTDPGSAIRLRFGTGLGSDELRLDRRQLGDALIGYCRETGIPIPRQAAKSVRAEGDNIAMMIEPGLAQRAG